MVKLVIENLLDKDTNTMKIDRLLAITMHLLNREIVTASSMAEKFEVSKRTIQRDIETLCMAGIPVTAHYGADGGYEILDTFHLEKGAVTKEDCLNIITALESLDSAFLSDEIRNTLEKVQAVSGGDAHEVFVDFSVSKEGVEKEQFRQLREAVRQKHPVRLTYLNVQQVESKREVEPVALIYQWYAWYLLAYCRNKNDYRLFKQQRIASYEVLDGSFTRQHRPVSDILEEQKQNDRQQYLEILLKCREEVRIPINEYMGGIAEELTEPGCFLYRMHVPVQERMWYSILLGFGTDVEVLEPLELRERIKKQAEELSRLYKNPGSNDDI